MAEHARSRHAELVEHLFTAVSESVPSYGPAQNDADRDDMLHGIGFTASLFLSTVIENRHPTKAERRALQRIGAQRFRQGVTTDELLTMLEVTRRAGYRYLLTLVPEAEVGDAEGLEVAGALSDRLSSFMPIVAAELADGYRAAQASPVVDGRARAVLVDRVLERRWGDSREIVEHGLRVGVDLTLEWAVLFAVPLGPGSWSPRRVAGALGEVLGPVVVGQVRSAPVPHLPMLARPVSGETWSTAVERLAAPARAQRVAVAHARPCDRLASTSAVWQQADPLLRFVRVAWRDSTVVPLRHLAHLAVLAAAPSAERIAFIREVLGEVVDDERLVDTLRATYEATDPSVDQVASKLHCHKNTVYQRWAKIERLTGLDLTVPAERQELLNAFVMWRCFQAELDEAPSTIRHTEA